jgi:hypothetical protein
MDTGTRAMRTQKAKPSLIDGGRALVESALATLRDLGVDAAIDRKPPKSRPVDYTATLRRGAKRAAVQIEAKRGLRPGTLGPLMLRLRDLKPPALLLTDSVTPQMAKLLRDAGIAFADTTGNAYLEFAGNIIYVTGNAPEGRPRDEKVVRAFQATGAASGVRAVVRTGTRRSTDTRVGSDAGSRERHGCPRDGRSRTSGFHNHNGSAGSTAAQHGGVVGALGHDVPRSLATYAAPSQVYGRRSRLVERGKVRYAARGARRPASSRSAHSLL